MGNTYNTQAERDASAKRDQALRDAEANRVSELRMRLSVKIVMAVIDRVVNEIIRPGPVPEERECYDMAGELRALTPNLEELAKSIIDVNKGVE